MRAATRRRSAGRATPRWRSCATISRARPILPSKKRSPRRCRCAGRNIRRTSISGSGTSRARRARTSTASWSRRRRCSGIYPRQASDAEARPPVLAYIAKRLLATIPVMAIVAVFVFALLRLTPGDPAAIIAGNAATAQDVANIRLRLGLDEPIVTQFFVWLAHIARGDFGESFFFKKTVASLIADRIEPTVMLSLTTIVLSVIVAVPLGVVAAYRQGTWIDRVVMGFSVLGFSVPVFVIGYLLIYLFAIELDWLPVQGYQPLREGIAGCLQRLILPSLTLSVIY